MGPRRSDALARRDEICGLFGWQDGGDLLRLVRYSTLSEHKTRAFSARAALQTSR